MKLLSKGIITLFSVAALAQGLNAKTTICYKNNWQSPSTIEKTKLDGGECKGEFSYKQMLKKGWYLKDIKITKGEKQGLTYSYILTDEKLINIDNANFLENKYAKLDYKPIVTKLDNVNDNNATINVGNLRVGESGIVQHYYRDNKSQIVATALVVSSDKNSSKVKLIPFLDIKQNAIPTTNRKAVNGDKVILNYMYDYSIIIAPSRDAFIVTRKKYKDNNFLHSDLMGAKLKFEGEPLPSKQFIKEFAASQNVGTIFFVIESKVYIVDAKTFAILDTDTISYNFVETKRMPFYTRVQKIEKKLLNQILDYKNWLNELLSFIGEGEDNRTDEEKLLEEDIKAGNLVIDGELYDSYYKKILGLR